MSHGLKIHQPHGGMFALVDVSATGLTGYDFEMDLLTTKGVAVMPGNTFGVSLENWVRIALTIDDEIFLQASDRIIAHERSRLGVDV